MFNGGPILLIPTSLALGLVCIHYHLGNLFSKQGYVVQFCDY